MMHTDNSSNRTGPSNSLRQKNSVKIPRFLRKLTYAGGLSLFVVLLAGAVAVAGTLSYTIQYGDTLSELAEQHGTSVDELADLNGISDPDLIITGDELLIPSDDADDTTDSGEPAEPVDIPDSGDSSGDSYVIQDGDTLTTIADKFGVTVEELIAWNDIADAEIIVVGDTLIIPVADFATNDDSSDDTSVDDSQVADEQTPAASDPVDDTGSDLVLHLALEGETLESIAAMYGISVEQLTAANHHAAAGVTPGMILKIPPAGLEGARITGMPAMAEQWPLVSELASVSLATSYWGTTVTAFELLGQLPDSENPHFGFRGDPQGMFGMTDDYGVYNEPLVDVLATFGYDATAFYTDGNTNELIAWIDSGVPVVVWVTYGFAPQERIVVESESGSYSLVAEQHALLVYGYDADGIEVVDVSDGAYKHFGWDEFVSSWTLFDGMSLAIAPI